MSQHSLFRPTSLKILSVLLLGLLVVLSALVPASEAAPSASNRRFLRQSTESRINRRGFKSSLLSTARGFGKRSGAHEEAVPAAANSAVSVMGRADVPAFAVAEEASGNPRLLALLVNLLDANGDGVISPHEVLRDI